MPRKNRDFKAEYERRIARGLAAGLARSQARGHPKHTERHATAPPGTKSVVYDAKLESGYKALLKGTTLTAAAKEVRVSPERLRHYVLGAGLAEKRGRKWAALPENRQRRMMTYSRGKAVTVLLDRDQASLLGIYMSDIGGFLTTNNAGVLTKFIGKGVTDVKGKFRPFETNPNAIYRLANTGPGQSFEQIYRIVM